MCSREISARNGLGKRWTTPGDRDLDRVPHRLLLEAAWALRGHVTAYDALYVAAAQARHATLVTADGPLARAPGLGIAVHDVRAPRAEA